MRAPPARLIAVRAAVKVWMSCQCRHRPIRIDWNPETGLSDVLGDLAALGYRAHLAPARRAKTPAAAPVGLDRALAWRAGAMQAMMYAEALYLDFNEMSIPRDFLR